MSPVAFEGIAGPQVPATNAAILRFPRSSSKYDRPISLMFSGFRVFLSFGDRCPAERARCLMICTGNREPRTDDWQQCLSEPECLYYYTLQSPMQQIAIYLVFYLSTHCLLLVFYLSTTYPHIVYTLSRDTLSMHCPTKQHNLQSMTNGRPG